MEIAEQYPNGAIRQLSVGMHTAEKKVDSEVGNQHTQECGCAVPVERLRGSKKPQGTGVQRGRIHDNRNQRECSAAAYTIIVIRAHTSFGSQAQ